MSTSLLSTNTFSLSVDLQKSQKTVAQLRDQVESLEKSLRSLTEMYNRDIMIPRRTKEEWEMKIKTLENQITKLTSKSHLAQEIRKLRGEVRSIKSYQIVPVTWNYLKLVIERIIKAMKRVKNAILSIPNIEWKATTMFFAALAAWLFVEKYVGEDYVVKY